MSEIGLNINVDSYNNEGIKTIKGNNNAEIYKLYILKNKRRLSLVGKNVKLGYVMAGTTKGDVIENLNITNAEQGEITFPITNRISKQDGVYSCQLAIYGADGFLEHTATFGLTVEANIFTKIAGEIADSKDFTYLENILDKASKLSEKLKENTSSATNANSNLESNITEANNINSKLLENTSTATSLNKNLESNINLAKEVKETIKDLDTKNIEATEKIERLEGLNAKAEELSNNINEALPVKDALVKNTEEAKAANTNLLAANQEATSKNTELQASLEKTKEFIDGLDGSQNIPQLRLDVTELQNGLKSNQSLAYSGSSISAENTLEGRTEGMKIKGRTLVNLVDERVNFIPNLGSNTLKVDNNVTTYSSVRIEPNTEYYIIKNKKTDRIICAMVDTLEAENAIENLPVTVISQDKVYKIRTTSKKILVCYIKTTLDESCKICIAKASSNYTEYFEGIKSFGEAEQEGDKYKITLLSHGRNLMNANDITSNSTQNFSNNNGIISGTFSRINQGTGVGDFKVRKKTKVKVKAICKGCRIIIQKCWLEGGEYREIIDTNNWSNNSNQSTLGVRVCYVDKNSKWYIENPHSNNSNFEIQDICCYKSEDSNSNYEPYKQDKKDILISAPLPGFDFGEDIMYEENGQVKITRNIDNYIFTGNETMRDTTEQDEKSGTGKYKVFALTVNKTIDINKNINNNFPKEQFNVAFQNMDSEGLAITQYGVYIKILKSKLSTQDTEGFKAWLKANQTVIYFLRTTPVTEIVENCVDIDLDTYQEKTYFNILNSLPGTLDFKVPSNIGSVVQNMAKEVNNIWDVINNLLVPSIVKANGNLAMLKLNNNLN
ncbi:TPA: BppU family phage baseplate upper protein [Clostridium perfringens]|nr:BppU family phage baseplate upper protein [Clostridium perfringens]